MVSWKKLKVRFCNDCGTLTAKSHNLPSVDYTYGGRSRDAGHAFDSALDIEHLCLCRCAVLHSSMSLMVMLIFVRADCFIVFMMLFAPVYDHSYVFALY